MITCDCRGEYTDRFALVRGSHSIGADSLPAVTDPAAAEGQRSGRRESTKDSLDESASGGVLSRSHGADISEEVSKNHELSLQTRNFVLKTKNFVSKPGILYSK